MSCPSPFIQIEQMFLSTHPHTRLTWSYNDNNDRIPFKTHFQGTLLPQRSCISVLIYEKVLPLRPVH